MADGIMEDVVHGLLEPGEIYLLVDTILLTASDKGPITIKQFKIGDAFDERNCVYLIETECEQQKFSLPGVREHLASRHLLCTMSQSLQLSAHGQPSSLLGGCSRALHFHGLRMKFSPQGSFEITHCFKFGPCPKRYTRVPHL